MTRRLPDQAEGLRRLFVADVRRMIAVLSAGKPAQGNDVASCLAIGLAGQGRRVLLLDETLSAGDHHPLFGLAMKHDLDSIMLRQTEIETAIVPCADGIHLLAGGGQARTLPRPRMETRIGLVNAFYRLAGKYDAVLVNAGRVALHSRPSFAWACQDVIMHCDKHADSATEAYGYIKSLHQSGERRFNLLYGGMTQAQAQKLYRNVTTVSRRHLQVMPEYLGVLPAAPGAAAEFMAGLASMVQSWPLPEHKGGHFPALMRRLLNGVNYPGILQAAVK